MARQQLAEVLAGRHWTYGDLPRLHADSKEFGFKAQLDLSGHAIDWSLRFGKRRRPSIATEKVVLDADRDGLWVVTEQERTLTNA